MSDEDFKRATNECYGGEDAGNVFTASIVGMPAHKSFAIRSLGRAANYAYAIRCPHMPNEHAQNYRPGIAHYWVLNEYDVLALMDALSRALIERHEITGTSAIVDDQ